MNKKLYRSKNDKKISGVCGGIAEYFGIDATIVRLLWVLAAFMNGLSVVAYVACVFIVPEVSGCIDVDYKEKK